MATAALSTYIGLTGRAVYAVLYGAADRSTVWSGSAFVAYGTAARNAGAVALTETDPGQYQGVTPNLPAGTYYRESFVRLGGSPAESDTNVTLDGPLPLTVGPDAQVPAVSVVCRGGRPTEAEAVTVLDPSLVTVRVTLAPAVGTVDGEALTGVLCRRSDLLAVAGPVALAADADDPRAGDATFDLDGADPGQYLWFVRSADAVIARGLLTVEASGFSS